MFHNKTIAAIATAQSAGGIGIIRVSGDKATEICDRIFSGVAGKKRSDSVGYRAYYGKISDGKKDIDECVATVFRSPHSYTGEDVVEISCHGGLYILKKALRAVLEAGACPAQAGEFTQRAFLNGKIDLTQAQAVMDYSLVIPSKESNSHLEIKSARVGALFLCYNGYERKSIQWQRT